MKTAAGLAELFLTAIHSPTGGVVGLVDELLDLCANHGVGLDWRDGRCRLTSGDETEEFAAPLRTSVFRAILARVATLGSVSAYGGEGDLTVAGKSGVQRFRLMNTPDQQWLELSIPAGVS